MLDGKLMLSKLVHPLKAEAPIEVILLCNNTLFKLIQFSRVFEFILVIEFGMLILAKFVHPLNAELPMSVT